MTNKRTKTGRTTTWLQLQNGTPLKQGWKQLPQFLAALSSGIDVGTGVDTMTSKAATELKAALTRQHTFYTYLSEMDEPQGDEQVEQFKKIHEILKGLFDQVQTLETAIDEYLIKHPR